MLHNLVLLLLPLLCLSLYTVDISAASHGRVVPEEVEIAFDADNWKLHIPTGTSCAVEVRYVPEPQSVTCLPGATVLPYRYDKGILRFESAECKADGQACDIVLKWPENRWAKTIQGFEADDKTMSPMADGLLVTGSSTARMWDVKKFFPDSNTLNRGFGGSQYWDLVCYAETILGKHSPETIVVYSGDNDISAGKSPEWAAADCITAVKRFRRIAPQSRIVVLGAKPSDSRWDLYPAMQAANKFVEQQVTGLEQVYFLDLGPLLLGSNGKPEQHYYLGDDLHLSEAGYRIWTDALLDFLQKIQD